MDVTGRTEGDPAAGVLTRNILRFVANWKPVPARTAVYAGDPAGQRHFEAAGFAVSPHVGGKLDSQQVLIVGPGGGREISRDRAAIADWLKAGGALFAVGLDQSNADAVLSIPVTFTNTEHIAAYFEPDGINSRLRGLGPADVHNRDPRELPLVTAGASIRGNGILAMVEKPDIVFCPLVPWEFDPTKTKQANFRRTYRRASFVATRLLANLGVPSTTPVLARFSSPVSTSPAEKRWVDGLYLDQPEEWDDPYRFFRW